MMRRAHWLAAVGSTTLGLAGLAGCQSMGGYDTGSWNGERSMVRAAEPDDPSGPSTLQLRSIQSLPAEQPQDDDPFAPISVEQFLPATSPGTRGSTPVVHNHAAPAGYVSSPAPAAPSAMVPPAPMAVMSPMPPAATMGGSHWDGHGSMHSGCSQCGSDGGC